MKWHEPTSSGVFGLINWLFKLKRYKDESADVHGKSYDLVLLHQLFSKTVAFFKHRNAKVISMKISDTEQLSLSSQTELLLNI